MFFLVNEHKIGDWVMVDFEDSGYPGEIINIIDGDYQVKAMEPFGAFWRWPAKEDVAVYEPANIMSTLSPPIVCGSQGQFSFSDI
jgi:hypothetical protein